MPTLGDRSPFLFLKFITSVESLISHEHLASLHPREHLSAQEEKGCALSESQGRLFPGFCDISIRSKN